MTGLLHKIKFYCVYSKMYFLVESFLSIRRLIAINSGMRQNFYLDPSLFFLL